MNCGLPEATVEYIRAVFYRYPEVETAILYGSRAKGNFKPGSDVDLTLLGPELTRQILGRIQSDLEVSPLPYRFDLSVLAQITHPELIEHVKRVGITFYQKNSPVVRQK
jgi:predicted nucleotidyltransferase